MVLSSKYLLVFCACIFLFFPSSAAAMLFCFVLSLQLHLIPGAEALCIPSGYAGLYACDCLGEPSMYIYTYIYAWRIQSRRSFYLLKKLAFSLCSFHYWCCEPHGQICELKRGCTVMHMHGPHVHTHTQTDELTQNRRLYISCM